MDDPGARPKQDQPDLVVIGASAGGVETLTNVVSGLPRDLAATVCIVLHLAPESPSALAGILRRAGPLPCHTAVDGEPLHPGQILVAPPDRHLVIEDAHVRLTIGPRENNHRPAVDVLFRSAALARGRRVIGVVLSGTRDDGTAGLALIKHQGGAAIVQDPADALYPGMPSSALQHVTVDAVVASAHIADAICAMVSGQGPPPDNDPVKPPADPPASGPATMICPECGGVLTERTEVGMTQWQCRVGHRYSPETLLGAQAYDIEAALWTAVRALRDRGILLHRLADRAHGHGGGRSARSFRRRAVAAEEQAQFVERALSHAAEHVVRKANDEGQPDEREGTAA